MLEPEIVAKLEQGEWERRIEDGIQLEFNKQTSLPVSNNMRVDEDDELIN